MRIIAVEDSARELSRIQRMILELYPDSNLLIFSDPMDVLRKYSDETPLPDIAFLDIDMPNINGMELAKELIAHKPNINIIFTTAYSDFMQDAFQIFASGFLLKPFTKEQLGEQFKHLRYPPATTESRFFARTIGEFEFFCDGKPVVFSSVRAKELLAYLVDRRGASVTKKELFAVLFEDTEYSSSKQDYLKKIVNYLKSTLDEIGAADILLHKRNSYAADTTLFDSDISQLPSREERVAANIGYMEQYTWAEYR